MAFVFASRAFNQSNLNLSQLFFNSLDVNFFNDQFLRFVGKTYRDVYEVIWRDGGTRMVSEFGGPRIVVNADGEVVGGTVTGYFEFQQSGGARSLTWGMQNVSVSAAALYDAASTRATNDEYAIIHRALKGSDVFRLSNAKDFAYGRGGKDVMDGNGGPDTLMGEGGSDRLLGDRGKDKLEGGPGNDTAIGGPGNDRLFGNNGNDLLNGKGGGDKLKGGNQSDKMRGGKGPDDLEGGKGPDRQFAGNDSHKDEFIYRKVTDSKSGATTRDKIYQFDAREDDVHLKRIDANTNKSGDQKFKFSDGPDANAIWIVDKGKHLLVRGDVDGDAEHDFEIQLMNINRVFEVDFVL